MEALITLADNKTKINVDGVTYDVTQLREVKEYLQLNNITSSQFFAESDEDVDILNSIIEKMAELSPEVVDNNINSYFLN